MTFPASGLLAGASQVVSDAWNAQIVRETLRGALLLLCVATTACGATTLTARPTKLPQDSKGVVDGLRYYLPMPHVLVRHPVLLGSTDATTTTTTSTPAPDATGRGQKGKPAAGTQPQAGRTDRKLGAGIDDEAEATGKEPGTATAKEKPAVAPPSGTGTEDETGIAIIMLPDFCEQHAIRIEERNAKLDVELQLVDGWRLESVKSSADSTAALAAWIDLAKTGITAAKDIGTAAIDARVKLKQATGGTEAHSGKLTPTMVKDVEVNTMVTEKWLKPGVYPLFARDGEQCEQPAKLKAAWFSGGDVVERTRNVREKTHEVTPGTTQ